jgi:hypothetical protein
MRDRRQRGGSRETPALGQRPCELDLDAPRPYAQPMVPLLRLALQVVLFLCLVSVAIAIGARETGPWEKGALLVLAAGLIWLAMRVRGLGARAA